MTIFMTCLMLGAAASAGAAEKDPLPRYDVPRLAGITVDGDTADWGERGFRVETLAAPARDAADFDAGLRLGWDDRGLLVLLTVRDDTASEEADAQALQRRDSVQLFLAPQPGARDLLQVTASPGVDPAHPELRFRVNDRRQTPALKAVAPEVSLARRPMLGGYVLEAILPWNALGVAAKPGVEVGFQVVVADADGPRPAVSALWYPVDGAASDARKLHRLRLSEAPAPPVRLAATGSYERFRRARVRVAGTADLAGKRVEIREGRRALASGVLEARGGRAAADLVLPMPALGATYPPLSVRVEGAAPGVVLLPDANALRRDAYRRAEIHFRPFAFPGPEFPPFDFEQPSLVEDLIGAYTLKAEFYDTGYRPVTTAEKPGRHGAVVTVAAEGGFQEKRYFTLYRLEKGINWRQAQVPLTVELPAEVGVPPEVAREQARALGDHLKQQWVDGLSRDGYSAVLLAGLRETAAGAPARVDARDGRWWYALRKQRGEMPDLRSLLHVPEGYHADPSRRWPLILFLHGSGERGDNLELVKTHGPPKIVETRKDFPFLVVSPQCPAGEWWSPWRLRDLLDEVCVKYRVDRERVYLTGLSMGGFGTWEMAIEFPGLFAAIAPICGGGDASAVAAIKDLPVWVFHGGKDTVVPLRMGEEMVEALKKLGSGAKLTVYPEASHDSWTETYANEALYEWFLQHRRAER